MYVSVELLLDLVGWRLFGLRCTMHDRDDAESIHRTSNPCKPCEQPVGDAWIRLGDVVDRIVTAAASARTGVCDDDDAEVGG